VYQSRLPRVAAELAARLDAVTRAAAERVERRAKTRVPVATGRLRDAIHTEREDTAEYVVVAGDTDAFYGHLVEHGGANTPGRPFLTPATEETRGELDALGREALKNL
jgi:HK97 gp10 family phage protein